ncbi:MAG: winged helix-turn-helix domain-containing protein [Roseiarcus sp.]|jgi:predicted ATPase/DNA-binding winged helix-turn-helix (wHTH) protein
MVVTPFSPKRALPADDGPAVAYVGDRYAFEEFQLWPTSRVLARNDAPVPLGARALDILVALVERAGQVVDKAELFARVWPNRFIEESNLRVHVAAVRKALGDGRSGTRFIASVPGRGYTFVAQVVRTPGRDGEADRQGASVTYGDYEGLPAALTRIFGRDEVVAEIADLLPRKRLVAITGTGGIGKTAVALAVAQRVANAYRDGVQIVDLAPLAHPALVAAHLASLLRLPALEKEPLQRILTHLQPRAQLIVLDNCEHVIDSVSDIAEAILARAPDVHLLGTSREPLRAAGEWVQRLTPLAVPPATPALNAAEAMRFAAVQLFVERLRAYDGSFALADSDACVIAEICARLDGLPLAIELAATRVPLFGLHGLAARLDDRFSILTKGRRTADPRHRTLAAMIDWSYEGLSDGERTVFRRLSVLRSPFTIEAADAIANDRPVDNFSMVDVLDDLLQKSLIVADSSSGVTRYRLLESLRLYAFTKLLANREAEHMRRRHAQYWYERSVGSGDNWIEVPKADWLIKHSTDIADLRAALDWAFAPQGDAALGIRIAAASAPMWFKMLLLPELRRYLEYAIALSEGMTEIDAAVRIRLHVALGHAIFHAIGPVPEVAKALSAGLGIAQRAGDLNSQLQFLWALYGHYSTAGEYEPMASAVAQVAEIHARHAEPIVAATYHRMAALSSHLLGDQEEALRHAEEALRYPAVQRHDGGFVYDHKTASSAHYCRALWMLGRPDQAAQVVGATIEHALRIDQPFAFGYFLVLGACPVAIWNGDLAAVRRYVALLLDEAIGVPLTIWRTEGEFYARVLAFLDAPESERSPAHVAQLLGKRLTLYQAERLSTFARQLLHPEPLAAALRGATNWCTAEILRKHGEILLASDSANGRSEAESLLLRSMDISRTQQALFWELRSATSLARLWRDSGRTAQAREILNRVYERFTEGLATRDLIEAKTLLDALH